MATEPDWKKKTVTLEGKLMSKKSYLVVCYEKIEGHGELCWYGEQEYLFDTKKEAQEFMNKRFSILGEKTEEHRLFNTDGTPTEQFLVTYSVACYKNSAPCLRCGNKTTGLYYLLKRFASGYYYYEPKDPGKQLEADEDCFDEDTIEDENFADGVSDDYPF